MTIMDDLIIFLMTTAAMLAVALYGYWLGLHAAGDSPYEHSDSGSDP